MADFLAGLTKTLEKNGYDVVSEGYLPAFIEQMNNEKVQTLLHARRHEIIFSHKFAKAFWGDVKMIDIDGEKHHTDTPYWCMEHWQYHLQTMVLEEDPIQYLKQFLDLTKSQE